MKVKDIMTTDVFYVSPDRRMDKVEDIIEWHAIRHVLVIDQFGHLQGVISQRDLLQTAFTNISISDQREFLKSVPVSNMMTSRVITATPNTDVMEAAWMLIENKIGCLPVVDETKKVVGIVTESDFVKWIAQRH